MAENKAQSCAASVFEPATNEGMTAVILWLEDRPSTARSYAQALRAGGLEYLVVGTVEEFAAYVSELDNPSGLVFMIDVMLPGVSDLSTIGVPGVLTGSGSRAGIVFVERFLRARDSRFRKCPIIFLTERFVDQEFRKEIESLARTGSAPVSILQKYAEADLEKFLPLLREFQEESRQLHADSRSEER